MQPDSDSVVVDARQKDACDHCGEPLPAPPVREGEGVFCCEGCRMVFSMLQEKDLCTYYELEPRAGISFKGRVREHFAFLDDQQLRDQLIDFSDGQVTRVRFHLPQIHCASCIWLLEHLYKLHEGIRDSKVNFPKKEISLVFEEDSLSLRKVVELLASIGYTPAIHLGDLDEPRNQAVSRRLYYQLGVAGFAFGNIMLLSFPEYLGLEADGGGSFQTGFGIANLVLALPVLLYSGQDYLRSAYLGLKHRHLNMDVPISLGILTLFFRSAFEILTHTGAGFLDSLAGLVFFLLIGKWFQQKTFHHLSFERDYRSYFPIAATLRTDDGSETTVPVNKLEPGQTLVLRHGELLPADGVLEQGEASMDYSFVTGESAPVPVRQGESLFAGGRQMGERIAVRLTRKVSQSYLTQLWNEDIFKKDQAPTATGRLADRVARYFTAVLLLIALGTLVYWLPRDVGIAVNAFTAVLIIACPCAVALSVPFTFGNSMRLMARRGLFLKDVHVIESLQRVGAIVFDKTGTLTSTGQGKVRYEGLPLPADERAQLLALVRQSAHPVSRHIETWLGTINEVPALHEFQEHAGQGIEATINGRRVRLGSAAFLRIPQSAGTWFSVDGQVRGCFQLDARYRTGMEETLQRLKPRFSLYLLSGDNARERERLAPLFGSGENLHFEQQPADKLAFIRSLQAQGQRVLMLGDGLNDAGALKQSDAGIVVAENTSNFTPASDAILSAARFEDLPAMLAFSRVSIRLVFGAYFLALIYNTIGLSFAVQGTLSPVIAAILMPASSVTIVLFGVLSSTWYAWKLLPKSINS